MLLLKTTLTVFFLLIYNAIFSCSGGTSDGTLTPTASYQTKSIKNGYYYSINVTSCNTYYFTFCSNGGSASFDTEITILDATGVTELEYNDDYCSTASQITWTASFTGTIRLLISEYSCNNDLSINSTLAYKYVPKSGSYCLTNDAIEITVGAETCIQLTSETNDLTGCAWNDNEINFNNDFTLSLDYYFGNNVNGADGTTFTFQPNSLASCGDNGSQLGAGSIANSLIVEFDTYDNDFPTHTVDIAADHIAIEIDGDLENSSHLAGPIAAISGGNNIDDGAIHSIDITWVESSHTFKVYFDGNLRLTTVYDFVTDVFGGDNTVYWGATASTGGLNNQQYFCPNTVIILPLELTSFESTCNNKYQYLNWVTATEDRLAYFLIESTYDGKFYQTLDTVVAYGNSTIDRKYQYALLDNNQNDNRLIYYRLKIVDLDGNIKNTELIIPKICKKQDKILNNYTFSNGNLSLLFNQKDVNYSLINMIGEKIINDENSKNEESQNIYIENLSEGFYILSLESKEGEKESYRILNMLSQ